jgi:hypothetical protein
VILSTNDYGQSWNYPTGIVYVSYNGVSQAVVGGEIKLDGVTTSTTTSSSYDLYYYTNATAVNCGSTHTWQIRVNTSAGWSPWSAQTSTTTYCTP